MLRAVSRKQFEICDIRAAYDVGFSIGDGLRPDSTRRARALSRQVADANESLWTATVPQFGEREL